MIPAFDDEINREETRQIKTDEKLMKRGRRRRIVIKINKIRRRI